MIPSNQPNDFNVSYTRRKSYLRQPQQTTICITWVVDEPVTYCAKFFSEQELNGPAGQI